MKENRFQAGLIRELKETFPGCMVLKNDASYMQGIPDLLILHGGKWAMLECKKSAHENHQPNQDTYVGRLNGMSYAAFIYPENKDEVMKDLRNLFS